MLAFQFSLCFLCVPYDFNYVCVGCKIVEERDATKADIEAVYTA